MLHTYCIGRGYGLAWWIVSDAISPPIPGVHRHVVCYKPVVIYAVHVFLLARFSGIWVKNFETSFIPYTFQTWGQAKSGAFFSTNYHKYEFIMNSYHCFCLTTCFVLVLLKTPLGSETNDCKVMASLRKHTLTDGNSLDNLIALTQNFDNFDS